uniref:Uncharacterized protein n=1 Tax=Melanopsichium pennsylvanicum 4 TaxID=1398559 RepID=A0A077QQP0_9BASI|nr:uncharacterized protein BN887_03542 [Melanopsichium pennsylvanicum 4]
MVGMKKFSITAAASAVMAVTGAAASLQPADASHAHHVISHRSLAERQQQPGMIKMQKRLGLNIIGDGLGGLVSGIGNDLGLGGTYSSLLVSRISGSSCDVRGNHAVA